MNYSFETNIKKILELTSDPKSHRKYLTNFIYYNKEKNEFVSTNCKNLIIVELKDYGVLDILLNIPTGYYVFVGNNIIPARCDQSTKFVDYQSQIVKEVPIISDNIFTGCLRFMIKTKKMINIWDNIHHKGIEPVLKILSRINYTWDFATIDNPDTPIMISMENVKYKIKYITMSKAYET